MPTLRQFLALLIALALVATACRSEASVQLAESEQAQSDPTQLDPTDSGDPLPQATPSAVVSPTPEATPEATSPDPSDIDAVEPFNGRAPAAFEGPASWDEPFELDAAVTEGVLANGMTYLIRNNQRPGAQAQLRLVVQAGSLNETPGTEGVAHFLEHMMFNGTERFPGNEIVQVLEGFGSGFGPDVNAYTSFEETVYELQVPTRSNESLQLGLDVLYQWATAATIDADDVVAERGVVREEYRRSEEGLSGRLNDQIIEVLFGGSDYLGSDPIGSVDVIETMTENELRAFYERWYRPELMTVIAVGDFDVADIQRRIADTFVQPASTDLLDPLQFKDDPGALLEPVFDVITDQEIQRAEIEVLWRLADQPVANPNTWRTDLVNDVTFSMLSTRLFERVQGGDGLFLTANASGGDFTPKTQVVSMGATAGDDDLQTALEQLLVEIERARQFGFSPDELDRELDAKRASVAQQFAERGTRQDNSFAYDLVAYSLSQDVQLDAATQQSIALEIIDSITVADAQRFLFEVLATDPYVLLTAPASLEPQLPIPEDLAATYYSVVGNTVEEQERERSSITELMIRPEPALEVDRQRIDPLQATIVTYANGARLIFRQTAEITENVVRLRAVSPGGFFAVDGPEVPLLDSSAALVGGSGFESVDIVTLEGFLSSSLATLGTSIGRAQESLSGQAATDDIETLFQMVHLQMTEPTITDLQVRQFQEQWRPLAENPNSNPPLAGDLELWRLRYGDSPWFRLIPTIEDLENLDEDLLLDAYRDRFADGGDFVFAVVGDFEPDELIALGASYLGTLPDSGRREVPIDRDPGIPEENLVATVAAGIGDQGRVRINWESPYPFTLEATVTAQALELVVNARLRDLIRERLGASYAPNAAISVLSEPKPWVDTIIEVESDPERVQEVSQAIREELDRIRAGDFDQQYLDLAVDQLTEDDRYSSNNQWIDLLLFHTQYVDRAPGEFLNVTQIARGLTVADLAEAASVVFPPTRSVEIRLVPAG